MKYTSLAILLPCHSLEDFPTHHKGDEAAGLLAGWTALWHPALLACTGKMPTWHRASSPPEDLQDRLIIVPGVGEAELPTGFVQKAQDHGACLLRGQTDRSTLLAAALEPLDPADRQVDPEWSADFLALGYCYLQIELLTRQMRYSSNLDEHHFQTQLIAAAQAAMQGDEATFQDRLSRCFDLLSQERDHYYPASAYVLDLTMVAPTTLGASLRTQLDSSSAVNLLLSGEVLEQIAAREPETLAALRRALDEQRASLVGGEYQELRLPELSCETLLDQLRRGLACYQSLLGHRPLVYGRRPFGLSPLLPQTLRRSGFQAALHMLLDDGVYPEGTQVKVRWEGPDGATIDALARPPRDAAKPDAFLNYGIKMGESLDMDHVATICLAHWPGCLSPWYEDLRRAARYGAALGKFVTIDHYVQQTDHPVHQDRFQPDQYRSPYLRQAIAGGQVDPISSVVRQWQQQGLVQAVQTLRTLGVLLSDSPPARLTESDAVTAQKQCLETAADTDWRAALEAATRQFDRLLPRSAERAEAGYLVANPHSFTRRVRVEMPELDGPVAVERPIYAADQSDGGQQVIVDVPPLGFVWVAPSRGARRGKKVEQPLADECRLRNEFFEALIDPKTGGLRAIRHYDARHNRLSQQLAMRLGQPPRKGGGAARDDDPSALYSVMVADAVQTTIATAVLGEIVARGRLLDHQGKELAGFRQTFRLARGSRVLEVEIELDPRAECQADPWSSYYCVRFAWANEAAELKRAVNQTRHAATAKRLEAPNYLELADGEARTAILTCGLPVHRRQGLRMLDSLLIVRGETCRRFQFGIGFDVKHPLQEALNLLTPVTAVARTAPPPAPTRSGWLFHIDARNVTATHWEPLIEEGRAQGFRARLLETLGRPAKAKLSAFRPLVSARQLNFDGTPWTDGTIEEGGLSLQLAAHEWIEIEGRW